jgi:hypothetical protein
MDQALRIARSIYPGYLLWLGYDETVQDGGAVGMETPRPDWTCCIMDVGSVGQNLAASPSNHVIEKITQGTE